MINKKDVIKLLETIALYLELKGENPFRIAAYRKAAQSLERDARSLNEIEDFSQIPGIGQATNDLIVEYIETGESSLLKTLQAEVPETLLPLLKLPGLGGKRVATLYKELNIVDADSLKQACLDGTIKKVRGFGTKTIANILQALEENNEQKERLPIYYMLQVAAKIAAYLETIPEIIRFDVAGSLRRLQETVKDIDYIIATEQPEKVKASLLKMPNIKKVVNQGDTKVSLLIEDEFVVAVDFRLVDEAAYSTTLHHFTGSKEHNVRMRQLAKQRGEKINEYGVENETTGEVKQFATETAFFQHFGLHYIPPELREDNGEIEKFQQAIPLIETEDIKGDLHMHTTWSDGANSIEEMVEAAIAKGYEYIAITDHSKFLQVANGLDEKRMLQQREVIEKVKAKYPEIMILAGVEMDILPDGSLDFADDFLKEMDWVIAAIHSSFQQTEAEIMQRLRTACENPYVHLIAHPTGRLIERRHPYPVDIAKLIQLAQETHTALELNANPMRFDLKPAHLQLAKEANVPIIINTDSHQVETLAYMDYGVKVARKAWLTTKEVVNSWSRKEVLEFIAKKRSFA